MTISTTNNRKSYAGDASTTAFAFPYRFLASTDISVYLDGVLQTAGYSVTGAGSASGGYVNFVSAPGSSVKVELVRIPDLLQTTDLSPNDPFPADSVEAMADKAMLGVQRAVDLANRGIHLPDGESNSTGLALPVAASRASQILAFDASGNLTVLPPTTGTFTTQASETGGVLEFGSIWIQRERIMPEQFGAASDGTSYTTALQNAINAASSRGVPLNLRGRTYRADCASQLLIPVAGVQIENGTLDLSHVPGTTYPIGTAAALGSSRAITGTLTAGTTYQLVVSTTGLSAGQDVLIKSSDLWAVGSTRGEWVTIKSIDSGTGLTLTQPVQYNYTTTPLLYAPTTVAQVILENVNLLGGGAGLAQNAIYLSLVKDVRVYGCSSRKFAARGFAYDTCKFIEADGGQPGEGDDTTGLSYGHVVSGATISAKFRAITGDRLRHVVTAGGSDGIVRGYRLDGITGTSMTDSTADAHGAVDDAKFYDIDHTGDVNAGGADGDGIVSQSRYTLIDGFKISGPGRHGILVQPQTTAAKSVVMIGKGEVKNHCAKVAYTGWAIDVDASAAGMQNIERVVIDDIDAESTQTNANGILIYTNTANVGTMRIGGARIVTPGKSLHLNINTTGKTIKVVDVQGGYYERTNTTAENIYAQAAGAGDIDTIKIHHAHVQGGQYGVRFGSTAGWVTNYNVSDNTIKGYLTGAVLGISDNTASYTAGGTQIYQRNNA